MKLPNFNPEYTESESLVNSGDHVMNGIRSLARVLSLGVFGGLIAGGLAGGIGSRIAMRITALMTESHLQGQLTDIGAVVGEFNLDETFFLMFLGAFLGIYGGIFFMAVREWLFGAWWLRGLTFGIILLFIYGSVIIEGDNIDFTRFGSVTVNLSMFAALPILFGIIIAGVVAWTERTFPTSSDDSIHWLGYGIGALLGGLILFFITADTIGTLFVSNDEDLFLTKPQAQIHVVVLVFIYASFATQSFIKFNPQWRQRLGYAFLAVPVIGGGVLLADAINKIIAVS